MGTWLERDGVLAAAVSAGDVADALWMMTSMRSYEALVVQRGWSSERWTRWIRKALHRMLLATP